MQSRKLRANKRAARPQRSCSGRRRSLVSDRSSSRETWLFLSRRRSETRARDDQWQYAVRVSGAPYLPLYNNRPTKHAPQPVKYNITQNVPLYTFIIILYCIPTYYSSTNSQRTKSFVSAFPNSFVWLTHYLTLFPARLF